ncbi:hypothetical protein Pfo_028743 [Paulownia fortunei]|nr:hypothetical protein Pfo_028743 [Paulownia fortunei]
MEEKQNTRKPHIIISPPPFQGHINPSIQLTLKLASKGFIITFINTHSTHDQITKARKHLKNKEDDDGIFAGARESGLDIRYRTISDGFPLTFDRSLHRDQFMEGRIHVFPAHVDELLGQLVADTFSNWGCAVARKYGLVYVSFWTQPALIWMLYSHLDLLKENGHYGSKDNRKDTIDYIPGVMALEPRDLVSFLQETDTSKVMHRIIDKAFAYAKKADFIICNTVEELEPEAISVLKERQPTYAIGPLFPSHFTNRAVEMNLWSESDCSRWLDSKPQGSVLYASFGSYAHTNKEDIKTIANGLMISGVSFIWVLRPDIVSSEATDILPNGCQENVGNRGLVVPWCKQNVVISHPAVGGFLTHCGWNSILESIWVGVPLICFPLVGDQTTNRKLVVDDWKIGINLCEGKLVSGNEVAERIKFLMSAETSHELRKKIEQVRKKLENALSCNGSSHINFEKFVEDMKAKIERHESEKKL